MTASDSDDRLTFLGRDLPSRFTRRIITIHPGQPHAYDPADWHDTIAVVEHGEIELESLHGHRCCHLEAGNVFWLAGLPILAIHPTGHDPATLTLVSRRSRSR
jgi:hypothetical protein